MLKVRYPEFLQCCQFTKETNELNIIESLSYGTESSDLNRKELLKITDPKMLYTTIINSIDSVAAVKCKKKKKTVKEIMIDNYLITKYDVRNYTSSCLHKISDDINLKLLLKQIGIKNITIENDTIINIDTSSSRRVGPTQTEN